MSRLNLILMVMHIATEVAFEDIHGTVCAFAVAGVHPQQQPAMIKMLHNPASLVVAEDFSEQGSQQPSGPTAQSGSAEDRRDRSSGGGNRSHQHSRPHVHEGADDRS